MQNKTLHRTAALAIAAATLLFAACTSQKTTTTAHPSAATAVGPQATPQQRYEAMTAAYGLWHDVQLPVRATLREPVSLSASGRLTMVRDSLVHLSMRVLGMEVAVVRMTADSLHVIDKFHRYMLAESTQSFAARTGLTLADVQCALLGRAFVPGTGAAGPPAAASLRISAAGTGLDISPAHPSAAFSWNMTAATLPDGRVALTAIEVQPRGHSAARCTYTPAETLTPAGAAATALELSATAGKKKLSATLRYTLPDARWNSASVPAMPSLRGYRRIPLGSLPEMFRLL